MSKSEVSLQMPMGPINGSAGVDSMSLGITRGNSLQTQPLDHKTLNPKPYTLNPIILSIPRCEYAL